MISRNAFHNPISKCYSQIPQCFKNTDNPSQRPHFPVNVHSRYIQNYWSIIKLLLMKNVKLFKMKNQYYCIIMGTLMIFFKKSPKNQFLSQLFHFWSTVLHTISFTAISQKGPIVWFWFLAQLWFIHMATTGYSRFCSTFLKLVIVPQERCVLWTLAGKWNSTFDVFFGL